LIFVFIDDLADLGVALAVSEERYAEGLAEE
jgi:hypothetical protein